MYTVRSCFAVTIAFLVVAIGWWAADAVVCCNSSSVASASGDVVASCQNKNRMFHTIEDYNEGTCYDNQTALSIRKCCPLGQSYDPKVRFCRPDGVNDEADLWQLMFRFLVPTKINLVMVGYNYEQPLCDAGDVLADVPSVGVYSQLKHWTSDFELPPSHCFDLTPSDELVARTCHAAGVVCCSSSNSDASGDHESISDVPTQVESCQNKNRTFHTVQVLGRATCDDNLTAVSIRKCCPWGKFIDPVYPQSCLPNYNYKSRQWITQQLMHLLNGKVRAVADAVMVGYNYEKLLCGDPNELVNMPASDITLNGMYPPKLEFLDICFDLTNKNMLVAKVCKRSLRCFKQTCVHRCCEYDQMIVDGPNVPECGLNEKPFTMFAYEIDEEGRQVGLSNKTIMPYYAEFKCSHRDMLEYGFQLTENGSLYLTYENRFVPDTEYCVGYSQGIVTDTIVAYICNADTVFMVERARASSISIFFRASYVVSTVCLALTLLMYITLPSFRNIQSYSVKCYMHHQFVSCICVIYQMSTGKETKKEKCLLFGYITLFVFLSTLCWLNVICFDIYHMIRHNISRNRNTSTSVRTVMYHFYCLGLPSIFVCTGFFFLISHESLQGLAPIFEVTGYGCFYYHTSDYEGLFSILLPVFLMLVANLFFFLLTAIHFSRMKLELNTCNLTDSKTKSFLVYKEKFVMSIKLFLIIGIPYFLTVLSIILRMEETKWNIIYATSSLQGVCIFIIFVAKHQVIMDLRNKFKGSMDHSEPIQMNNIPGS